MDTQIGVGCRLRPTKHKLICDNVGDGKKHITFQFRFTSTSKKTALTVGGKSVLIPLINSGPISGVNPAAPNVRERYTVDIVCGDRRTGTRTRLTNAAGGTTVFDKPVDWHVRYAESWLQTERCTGWRFSADRWRSQGRQTIPSRLLFDRFCWVVEPKPSHF